MGKFVLNQEGNLFLDCLRRSTAERDVVSLAIGNLLPDISPAPTYSPHRTQLIVCFPTLGSGRSVQGIDASRHTMAGALDERVALVTGGSSRIGAEICRQLAVAGATVVIHCHRNLEAAWEVEEHITNLGGEAFVVQLDLSEESDRSALVDAVIEETGRLDILVNNASIFQSTPLDKMTSEAAEMMWKINAEAPLMLTHHAAPHLRFGGRDQPGSVINLIDNEK